MRGSAFEEVVGHPGDAAVEERAAASVLLEQREDLRGERGVAGALGLDEGSLRGQREVGGAVKQRLDLFPACGVDGASGMCAGRRRLSRRA